MDLPTAAAPGVEERAAALADAACHLYDAVGPGVWSEAAACDAVEAVEIIARALVTLHPHVERIITPVLTAMDDLQTRLSPPAAAGTGVNAQVPPPVPTTVKHRSRGRRGLGRGFQGIQMPGAPTSI